MKNNWPHCELSKLFWFMAQRCKFFINSQFSRAMQMESAKQREHMIPQKGKYSFSFCTRLSLSTPAYEFVADISLQLTMSFESNAYLSFFPLFIFIWESKFWLKFCFPLCPEWTTCPLLIVRGKNQIQGSEQQHLIPSGIHYGCWAHGPTLEAHCIMGTIIYMQCGHCLITCYQHVILKKSSMDSNQYHNKHNDTFKNCRCM